MTAALSAASEVLETVIVIDAVLTTSRFSFGGGGGPNSGAGALTLSFMPAAGALVIPPSGGAMSSRDAEQAVSTLNTTMPAIAADTHLRFNLEIRFMIINLAIGCEARQSAQFNAHAVGARPSLRRFDHPANPVTKRVDERAMS